MTIDLPKLRRDVDITENNRPTLTFHQWMDQIIGSIQTSVNDLSDVVDNIQTALLAVNEAFLELARINSYPVPTNVLTATDAGVDASIVVADHERIYPVMGPYDVNNLNVTGGTITGLSFSTLYYVYYDDTTLTNGAPTFVATTSITDAQVGAESGRHYLGSITTPANGAGDTSGTGPRPPGGAGPLT